MINTRYIRREKTHHIAVICWALNSRHDHFMKKQKLAYLNPKHTRNIVGFVSTMDSIEFLRFLVPFGRFIHLKHTLFTRISKTRTRAKQQDYSELSMGLNLIGRNKDWIRSTETMPMTMVARVQSNSVWKWKNEKLLPTIPRPIDANRFTASQ